MSGPFCITRRPSGAKVEIVAEDQEAPNDELENQESDPQPETDPVEERFARLEASLTGITDAHQRTANYVGGLGRQIEKLLAAPTTPARDERLDALLEEWEDRKIADMEPEAATHYLLQKSRQKPEPEPKAVETNAPNDGVLVRAEYLNSFMPEMAEEAARLGIPFTLFWAKTQPKIDAQELRRGEGTPTDPRGWRPLAKEIKALMQAEATLQKNQAKSRASIDTSRGVSNPPKNYAGTSMRELSDDEFMANQEAIMRQRIEAQRR